MPPTPRSELLDLTLAAHGGNAPPGVLDFSTGVSPLPVPEAVLEALRAADVTRYPHPTALPLRLAVARNHGVDPEAVVGGSGATELIWALARAFGGPDRTVLAPSPAFAEYAQAARASGARLIQFPAPVPSARWEPDRVAELARRKEASLVFVARPGTPWPEVAPAEAIEALARALPDALVVVDEAYLPFFEGVRPLQAGCNVALLCSLTKVLALAGLRIGYLVADCVVARAVRAALPPWNVSAPACAAGAVALQQPQEMERTRTQVRRLREHLAGQLVAAGTRIDAAGGPFLLCDVGDASRFTGALLRRGLLVRDCTSFGLPRHVRVGVRLPAENVLLAERWPREREGLI